MIFQNAKTQVGKKNKFDLSQEKKLSMKMGDLVPVFLDHVIPNDTFNIKSEALVRLSPLSKPMMHRVDCDMHYFFVPYRLLWSSWEDFATGGDDGTTLPSHPNIHLGDTFNEDDQLVAKGSLSDYFGIPPITSGDTDIQISSLPYRAYQLIFNEYYRDQNLVDKVPIPNGSGLELSADLENLMTMRKRAWQKDYFTSALPNTQKGPEVTFPIGNVQKAEFIDGSDFAAVGQRRNITVQQDTDAQTAKLEAQDSTGANTDLELVTEATTINDFRKANAIQRWFETLMRTGSRYKEQIYSMFNIRSKDSRLDRPEYLGGGKKPIVISEVLSTYKSSMNANDDPVGDLYGHGMSYGDGYRFRKPTTFTEHGMVIGIMSVLPKTAYHQGINKSWFRLDKFDHYFPHFANLGEQPVLNKELYISATADDDKVFGYQQRYADYKYNTDGVHGDFRDNLDDWTMARKFDSKPELNAQFVTSDPTTRIFQITDPTIDTLWCQVYHKVDALRPIPYLSNPQLS